MKTGLKLSTAGDLLAAVFILAIVYVLVRPRSAAADMVRLFGDAVSTLVQTATDL